MDTTKNSILGGTVTLMQPLDGYRTSIDAVFLAALVGSHHQNNEDFQGTVLDIGTGAGTALLAAAKRLPHLKGTGLEFQRDMVRLAAQNIKDNGMHERLDVIQGDLLTPPPRLAASSFDHVIANPPYYESTASIESPNETKATSHHDKGTKLKDWIDFTYRMVKPKGYASFVFTTARLDTLLSHIIGRFGEITILPLWPKDGRESKRVLVHARKNVKSPSRLLHGLVVHQPDGNYTKEATDILVHGHGFSF